MSWGTSASHIPVLTLLPKLYQIKRVLEIGSGDLSTPLFLNRKIFPKLELLASVEEDEKWYEKIKYRYGVDPRLDMWSHMPLNIHGYDLVFIDGPQDKDRRTKVIRYFMRNVDHSLVAIHDIEVGGYRNPIHRNYNEYIFHFIPSPQTGLYSKNPLPHKKLVRYNRIMKKYFNQFEENALSWLEVFSS